MLEVVVDVPHQDIPSGSSFSFCVAIAETTEADNGFVVRKCQVGNCIS